MKSEIKSEEIEKLLAKKQQKCSFRIKKTRESLGSQCYHENNNLEKNIQE